jgi:RNA polymerase sigma factor (sigma-70 family)
LDNRPLSGVLRRLRSDLAAQETRGLTDAELLGRFASESDGAAFSALMERHSSMVLGVCRRVLGHAQDAEDACQATFLVLARKARSIRKTASLGSWLHGVAYRVSLRLKSAATRRPQPNSCLRDPAAADTAFVVSWQEVMQVLDEELDRLPATYRAPLVLCYLEGQTMDEGAKQLGWKLGAFRGRLQRGRDMLRKRLTRRGITLPAVLFSVGLSSSISSAAMPTTYVSERAKSSPRASCAEVLQRAALDPSADRVKWLALRPSQCTSAPGGCDRTSEAGRRPSAPEEGSQGRAVRHSGRTSGEVPTKPSSADWATARPLDALQAVLAAAATGGVLEESMR